MHPIRPGNSDLDVSRICMGCMVLEMQKQITIAGMLGATEIWNVIRYGLE